MRSNYQILVLSLVLGGLASCRPEASDRAVEHGSEMQDCPECPEVVVIGPGSFERLDHPNPWVRGDRESRGATHTVTVPQPFAIGRFEVTHGEWRSCVDRGGCDPLPDRLEGADASHPVTHVNWAEAKAYTQWLSEVTGETYRLSSEADWELAARGGEHDRFFGSATPEGLCDVANLAGTETDFDWSTDLCGDGFLRTAAVGSLRPNGYGLFDVAGNVWEWVEDCYQDPDWESRGEWTNEYRARTPRDGSPYVGTDAECASRMMRGGSWRNGSTHVFSPHFRNFDYAVRRYPNLGFRVVRELR